MPFTRRPDTFLVLSGPKPANRNRQHRRGHRLAFRVRLGGAASRGCRSRGCRSAVVAPVVAAPVVAAPVVAVSPARRAARRQRRDNRGPGRAHRLEDRERLRAAAAAFIVIAVASASAVIIAVLGGADRPSTNEASIEVPSTNVQLTSPAVTPKAAPPTFGWACTAVRSTAGGQWSDAGSTTAIIAPGDDGESRGRYDWASNCCAESSQPRPHARRHLLTGAPWQFDLPRRARECL